MSRRLPRDGDWMRRIAGRWQHVSTAELLEALRRLGVVTEGIQLQASVAGFAYRQVGYIHTDNTVRLARSDASQAEADASVICLEPGGVAVGATGLFVTSCVLDGFTGGTVNAPGYVGTTPGSITVTPPVTPTAAYSKAIGRFLTSTRFLFRPSPELPPYATAAS